MTDPRGEVHVEHDQTGIVLSEEHLLLLSAGITEAELNALPFTDLVRLYVLADQELRHVRRHTPCRKL